jgi:hypothetical protein
VPKLILRDLFAVVNIVILAELILGDVDSRRL